MTIKLIEYTSVYHDFAFKIQTFITQINHLLQISANYHIMEKLLIIAAKFV